ncbi:unnamed protein product [Brassicogethes aeneus]|uniref:Cathepsin propeptide inhibitor domain-containing protein n=1 Tax=Brassicogethes aeneus TaxID=1431903 RepID=A0A9P0BDZ7_BRAAE|nr:unnamed protein product [Brassicogethes aeneus]
MLSKLIFVFSLVLVVYADQKLWEEYKQKYNKVYTPKEDDEHYINYLKNVRDIKKHNKRYDAGLETYTMGINQFTDMSLNDDYFNQKYFGKL